MDINNTSVEFSMIGVCTECGIAITSKENVGERSPKLICKKCIEKEAADRIAAEKAKEREAKNKNKYAKSKIIKSFIITAVVVVILSALLIVFAPTAWLGITVAAILLYIAALQIIWAAGPLADIFEFFLSAPKFTFGFIIELSIDGILWYLAVKFALWILGIILSVVCFFLGVALCMALGVFFFPFTLYKAIKHPEDIEFIL